jgi:hypothetical protein
VDESAELERAYRRLVACYPKSFRRENEEEILTVLLATAGKGQRRPGVAESADLIKGALRMRMGLSRAPRTVLAAVRLMYLGAVAELSVLVTLLLTEGSIRTAVAQRNPQLTAAQLGSLTSVFIADTVILSIAIAGWLWLAWANGKGRDWARLAATVCCALYTAGLIIDLTGGTARYAPAALIATAVSWAIGLAAVVLLFMKQSWPYYARQ